MNSQGWFPLGLIGLISLLSKGLTRVLQHHSSKAPILPHSAFFIVQLSHPYMTAGKTIALTIGTFISKVMSLLFNMQFGFVIAFLPRSKHLSISWPQSPSTVILEPKKIKSSSFSAIKVASSAYLRLLIFLLAILIPACDSSSPVFHMMYSAYKLNKQGDKIQSWCTPSPILNQSFVPCLVLTFASWPACRFLKRQVRWSGFPISLRIFHSLLWST